MRRKQRSITAEAARLYREVADREGRFGVSSALTSSGSSFADASKGRILGLNDAFLRIVGVTTGRGLGLRDDVRWERG